MGNKNSKLRVEINKVYKKASKNKSRYRIIYGGSGSGKSHYLAQETIINMLQNKDYNYLVVRKTAKSIRNSVFESVVTLIKDMNFIEMFRINKTEMSITCINGSKLITAGLDDVEKLKSIANINRIWVEEASEIFELDFEQLDLRLRGTSKLGYQITFTFNPISDTHWIKKRFFDIGMEDSFILKTTYLDNRFLDESYKTLLINLKHTNYNYYRIYALAEWGTTGTTIYTNWEKQDLTDIIPTFDKIYCALDFGFSTDPTAFIGVHYDKTRKIIYIFDEFGGQEMFIDAIVEEINKRDYIKTITCDSSEPRSIAELRRYGVSAVGAKKGKGSIEHGIKFIQSNKIIVDSSCVNVIGELSSYTYKKSKDGQTIPMPEDTNNHWLDALRYSLETEMVGMNKIGSISKIGFGL